MNARIALVNDHRWIDPPNPNAYIRNILEEDRILGEALTAKGMTVARVDWADPGIDWQGFDAIVIRQTWDYFERLDEFRVWLDRVEHITRVINPVGVVRWNCDKHYLLDLIAAGVPTVPTIAIECQNPAPGLGDLMQVHGFTEAVIKPAVSGAGRETYHVEQTGAGKLQPTWERLVADECMLLQPFMPAIIDQGEVSLVVIDGEVTHAVRKIAAAGEFRVQDDHGGTVHAHSPTREESEVARAALAAVPGVVSYARVDLVQTEAGPVIMELELIEPELFFRNQPVAAERLADRIANRVAAGIIDSQNPLDAAQTSGMRKP